MKIGILTQYYPPELGAPQQRLSALAERLVARGHEVIVLTAMPSYPLGRTFEGYGGLHRREVRNGVIVHRVPAFPTQSAALSRRLLNYGSFVLTSALAGAMCFRGRLDLLLTESPPLFLGLSGRWLSRICRARWVFNVSDLWPESVVSLGVVKDSMALRAAYALEAWCYRNAALVTGQSRSIVAHIRRRFPSVKTFHLSNGVDTTVFHPAAGRDDVRRVLRDGRACSVLYAGLHGLAQGLDHVLTAATLLEGADIRITLLGDGPLKVTLRARADAERPGLVRFEAPRPADEMPLWVGSADISLVTLGMSIPGAVPSKLYEAMAAGRPIVLMAEGEAAEVVREADCGLVVAPADAEGLAAALRRLADDPELRHRMGTNGRRSAETLFDRDAIVRAFAEQIEAEPLR